MGGYLANYGAGDEAREKRTRGLLIVAGVIVVVGGLYLLTFKTPILERYIRVVQILKNHRQERAIQAFFDLLRKQDYRGAYALWGCTDAKPCRDYPLTSFMEDWGPKSARTSAANYRITKSRSCGSGVIMTVDASGRPEEKLWVEKDDETIGFSPWPGCPPGR
ncbi:MAG TPA: hypothetical protein VJN43_22100 [Bryobacteraceae bacterium]|nr:hypothetical protein [Bryobacteraceae bacterium]